jgi:hypothetical protein
MEGAANVLGAPLSFVGASTSLHTPSLTDRSGRLGGRLRRAPGPSQLGGSRVRDSSAGSFLNALRDCVSKLRVGVIRGARCASRWQSGSVTEAIPDPSGPAPE